MIITILSLTFCLLVSFIFLWKSGEYCMHYAIELAVLLGIPKMVIGFVILAIGTNIPEMFVGLSSLLNNVPLLSFGNLIGANITNATILVGLPLLIFPKTYRIDKPSWIMHMIVLNGCIMSVILLSTSLPKWYGIVLIIVYLITITYLLRMKMVDHHDSIIENMVTSKDRSSPIFTIIKLIVSLCIVLASSNIVVSCGTHFAQLLNIKIAIVGATLLALGTTLPDIILNIMAVRMNEFELALGNALGSMLLNGSLILGILLISAGPLTPERLFSFLLMFILPALAIIGYATLRGDKINYREGFLLVAIYISYIAYLGFSNYT